MEFKVGEEFDETNESSSKKNNTVMNWIIIIAISLISGIVVYFITDRLINSNTKAPEEPAQEKKLLLTEDSVQILYRYVSYGIRNKRNDKFLRESSTSLSSFTEEEKFYYALQFARGKDFKDTGKTSSSGAKIYNLSSATMKEFMNRFFGPTVTFSNQVSMNYTFKFTLNGKNTGTFRSADVDGFNISFEKLERNIEPSLVEPYYTRLVAAYQEPSGKYRLEEKVIYTRLEKNGNNYNVYIYNDYNKTKLIETISNQTETSLRQNPVAIDKYLDQASTVSYYFALDNSILYFESSQITN